MAYYEKLQSMSLLLQIVSDVRKNFNLTVKCQEIWRMEILVKEEMVGNQCRLGAEL